MCRIQFHRAPQLPLNDSCGRKCSVWEAEHGSWWSWTNGVWCNHHSSQQLSLYQGEPSFWSQAESSPPFCQCSFPWGERIHPILEVLPCSFQWVFSHIRPEKTKCQHSQHSELLLPSCHQVFYSTSPRTEWKNSRAATAPAMGTAGAEDGVRAPCADQQSCICMKEKFLPKWGLSDRTESKAVALRTWE